MTLIAALGSIVPQIVRAVYFAETVFAEAKSGASKLAAVLPQVEAIIDGAPISDEHKSALKAKAEHIVNTIVAALNDLGALGDVVKLLGVSAPASAATVDNTASPGKTVGSTEPGAA